MAGSRNRWTILLTLLATLAAAGGVGVAAELSFEELGHLAPSADAGLLAPITENGRTGWDCAPEKAARAKTARAAELPASDR